MIRVTDTIELDDKEIEEDFIRSPGPGGQHVNKTESAVQLRFNARTSPSLSNAVYLRLVPLAGRRMTKDGITVITANRFRERERNRADAMERLIEMIRAAATPAKRRRATKPTLASKKRRIEGKQRRGETKKERGKPGLHE